MCRDVFLFEDSWQLHKLCHRLMAKDWVKSSAWAHSFHVRKALKQKSLRRIFQSRSLHFMTFLWQVDTTTPPGPRLVLVLDAFGFRFFFSFFSLLKRRSFWGTLHWAIAQRKQKGPILEAVHFLCWTPRVRIHSSGVLSLSVSKAPQCILSYPRNTPRPFQKTPKGTKTSQKDLKTHQQGHQKALKTQKSYKNPPTFRSFHLSSSEWGESSHWWVYLRHAQRCTSAWLGSRDLEVHGEVTWAAVLGRWKSLEEVMVFFGVFLGFFSVFWVAFCFFFFCWFFGVF